jgi:F-type H+-transporting ATPase subunit delta
MKIASRGVARRYSRALLDLTTAGGAAKGDTVSAERLAEELKSSVRMLDDAPELAAAIVDPLVPLARRRALAEAVWTKAGASPLLLRLLGLLAEQGRLDLLPAIEEAYRETWNARRGVVAAEAVSAIDLDAASVEALRRALARVSGLEVDLRVTKDPSVLGGALVRMGGKSYDGTVRGRLKALKERLARGA